MYEIHVDIKSIELDRISFHLKLNVKDYSLFWVAG
jgi:hypothetical protein